MARRPNPPDPLAHLFPDPHAKAKREYIPESPSLSAQLAALAVGDTLTLPGGRVVRVKPREYCLHADNNKARARWGTVEEIEEDTRFFLTNGVLPKANGGPW